MGAGILCLLDGALRSSGLSMLQLAKVKLIYCTNFMSFLVLSLLSLLEHLFMCTQGFKIFQLRTSGEKIIGKFLQIYNGSQLSEPILWIHIHMHTIVLMLHMSLALVIGSNC